jgi:hypothetical protein
LLVPAFAGASSAVIDAAMGTLTWVPLALFLAILPISIWRIENLRFELNEDSVCGPRPATLWEFRRRCIPRADVEAKRARKRVFGGVVLTSTSRDSVLVHPMLSRQAKRCILETLELSHLARS